MNDHATIVPDLPPEPKLTGRKRHAGDGGLFVTDEELIKKMGVPEKLARRVLQKFDEEPKRTGFPQKIRLMGDRRFLPAVIAYFDFLYGCKLGTSPQRGKGHE